MSAKLSADDSGRIRYFEGYLNAVREAVLVDGVDVRSYFAWVPTAIQIVERG